VTHFQELVERGAAKHGITLEWVPTHDPVTSIDCVVLHYSRPGTPVRTAIIFDVDEHGCRSEGGSPLCAADVVHNFRRNLESRRIR
jgi:hypothetical protein